MPGVDAVFVGRNDLAHSMGFENRFREAAVQAATERTLKAVAAAVRCPGVLPLSPEDEDRYAGWSARYFATVTTAIITRASERSRAGRAQADELLSPRAGHPRRGHWEPR